MAMRSAKRCRFQANGVNIKIEEYDYDDPAEEMETTNSESTNAAGDGFYESEDTNVNKLMIAVNGQFDHGQQLLVRFKPGSLVTNVILWLDKNDDATKYTCPSFRVQQFRITGQTKGGKTNFFLKGVSNGSYARPTS